MTTIIYNFFEIMATFIESFICYKFVDLFVIKKIHNKKSIILSIILTFIIYAIDFYKLVSPYTLIIAILFVSFTCRIIFETSVFDAFSISSFFSLCLLFFDFFSMAVLGFLLGKQYFAMEVIQEQTINRCVFLVVSKFILILGYCIVRKVLIVSQKFKMVNLLFITVIGYIGIVYFSKLTFEYIDINIVVSWFLLLIIAVLAFFSFIAYIRYIKEVDEKKVIEVRNGIIAASCNEISKSYRGNAQLYHDMKNHMAVLSNLIENKKYEQAQEYINTLTNVSSSLQYIWTGNDILDCIINLKRTMCEQAGIKLEIDVDSINIKINSFVMSTIVSNLLDNAIEACERNSDDKKWISIAVRLINRIIIIKIQNPIDGNLMGNNGLSTTHKQDKNKHGWGLKSVEAAVNKEDGIFTYSYDAMRFTTVITLFL